MSDYANNMPQESNETLFPDWLRRGYVTVNGCASVAGLVAGATAGNIAVAESGLQGVAEISISNTQMKDADQKQHVGDKRRKRIYTAITGLSLTGASVAIGEAAGIWDIASEVPYANEMGLGASSIVAASGIAAATTIYKRAKNKYGKLNVKSNRTKLKTPEHDAIKHIVWKDLPIATIATISALVRIIQYQKTGEDCLGPTEDILGVISGAWGAYLFRPTKGNLEHRPNDDKELLPKAIEELEQIQS